MSMPKLTEIYLINEASKVGPAKIRDASSMSYEEALAMSENDEYIAKVFGYGAMKMLSLDYYLPGWNSLEFAIIDGWLYMQIKDNLPDHYLKDMEDGDPNLYLKPGWRFVLDKGDGGWCYIEPGEDPAEVTEQGAEYIRNSFAQAGEDFRMHQNVIDASKLGNLSGNPTKLKN